MQTVNTIHLSYVPDNNGKVAALTELAMLLGRMTDGEAFKIDAISYDDGTTISVEDSPDFPDDIVRNDSFEFQFQRSDHGVLHVRCNDSRGHHECRPIFVNGVLTEILECLKAHQCGEWAAINLRTGQVVAV